MDDSLRNILIILSVLVFLFFTLIVVVPKAIKTSTQAATVKLRIAPPPCGLYDLTLSVNSNNYCLGYEVNF